MDEAPRREVARIEEELASLRGRRAWAEMIPLAERLLAFVSNEPSADVMDVAGCHYNLGWLLERTADWERAGMKGIEVDRIELA